jgi:translation initiation factor 2 alpha subunit (eIF-2alpha)
MMCVKDVLRVIRTDKAGNLDLSKRDISESDRAQTLRYHAQARIVHAVVCSAAAKLRCCVQCLYAAVVWPAAQKHGSAYQVHCLSLSISVAKSDCMAVGGMDCVVVVAGVSLGAGGPGAGVQ